MKYASRMHFIGSTTDTHNAHTEEKLFQLGEREGQRGTFLIKNVQFGHTYLNQH